MYNSNIKNDYLETIDKTTIKYDKTVAIFKELMKYETKEGKDISLFDKEELFNTLKTLKLSTSRTYLLQYYIDYCKAMNYTDQENYIANMSVRERETFRKGITEYITKDRLVNSVKKFNTMSEPAIYKLAMLLAFCGVRTTEELMSIKITDINSILNTITLPSGRVIKHELIDGKLYNLCETVAFKTKYSYERNDLNLDISDMDIIFKAGKTGNDSRRFINLYQKIKSITGFSRSDLFTNGIMYMLEKYLTEQGYTLNDYFKKESGFKPIKLANLYLEEIGYDAPNFKVTGYLTYMAQQDQY